MTAKKIFLAMCTSNTPELRVTFPILQWVQFQERPFQADRSLIVFNTWRKRDHLKDQLLNEIPHMKVWERGPPSSLNY